MTQSVRLGSSVDLYLTQGISYSKLFEILDNNEPAQFQSELKIELRPYANSGDIVESVVLVTNESTGEINIEISSDITTDMSKERYIYRLLDGSSLVISGQILMDRF